MFQTTNQFCSSIFAPKKKTTSSLLSLRTSAPMGSQVNGVLFVTGTPAPDEKKHGRVKETHHSYGGFLKFGGTSICNIFVDIVLYVYIYR